MSLNWLHLCVQKHSLVEGSYLQGAPADGAKVGDRYWECSKGPSEHFIWGDCVGKVSASESLDRKTRTKARFVACWGQGDLQGLLGSLQKSPAAGGVLTWSIASYRSTFDVIMWDEEEVMALDLACVEEDRIFFHSSKHGEVGRIHDMFVNFYSPRNCIQQYKNIVIARMRLKESLLTKAHFPQQCLLCPLRVWPDFYF